MLRFDLQQCDVAFLVASDQLRLVLIAVLGGDCNAFGVGDYVIIRHNVAVLAHDKSRTEALRMR